jgi:16S rRNA (guanine(966)-N(2))-methyltransferase RsmD
VREAVFDILGDAIAQRQTLDLFAGSGALAIEALSRGAAYAVLVENDASAVRVIEENLKRAEMTERADIIKADFRTALRRLQGRQEVYNLVFIDPPYRTGIAHEVTGALSKYQVISPDAIIIFEHFKKDEPPSGIADIPLVQTRTYGQTNLSFFGVDLPLRARKT